MRNLTFPDMGAAIERARSLAEINQSTAYSVYLHDAGKYYVWPRGGALTSIPGAFEVATVRFIPSGIIKGSWERTAATTVVEYKI